ncbi:MAG: hypothetical protein EOM87_07860 [Clostridia bacterium]|nr:hypothetical protein [Clostridia bacterium]
MRRIILITIIVIIICMLFACSENNVVTVEQANFNRLIEQIDEIERLTAEYSEGNVFSNTLIYIRGKRYNDIYWNTLAGASDTEFEDYVLSNQELESSAIRDIKQIVIPSTRDIVDFVHTVGTMNMALNGQASSDLGGFAGDITQLVRDIKNTQGDFDMIYNAAAAQFGQPGGFDYADVFANIDAVNMVANYNNNSRVFSIILKDYYNNLTHTSRIEQYLYNEFGGTVFTLEELRDIVHQRVIDNLYIKVLFAKDNLSMVKYYDHIKACCYVYADYLLQGK